MPQCLSVDVAKAQGPVLHVEGLRAASGELGEWKIKEEESVRCGGTEGNRAFEEANENRAAACGPGPGPAFSLELCCGWRLLPYSPTIKPVTQILPSRHFLFPSVISVSRDNFLKWVV